MWTSPTGLNVFMAYFQLAVINLLPVVDIMAYAYYTKSYDFMRVWERWTFEARIHLNNVHTFGSYITENVICLHYKEQCWYSD